MLNHSFILPGLIGVLTSSCVFGYILAGVRGLI